MKRNKKSYYVEVIENGLDLDSTLWNIMNRVDEYVNKFENYLIKLEKYRIIKRKDRQEIIKTFWKIVNKKIFIDPVIKAKEEINKKYVEEIKITINPIKNDLLVVKRKIRKEIKKSFTPLIIYNVGFQEGKKSKNTKRYKFKSAGRPRLIVERVL